MGHLKLNEVKKKRWKRAVLIFNNNASIGEFGYSLPTGVPGQPDHQLARLLWAGPGAPYEWNWLLQPVFLQKLWHAVSKSRLV